MEVVVPSQEEDPAIIADEFNLESLLLDFSPDELELDFDFSFQESNSPSEILPPISMDEVARLLMDDDDGGKAGESEVKAYDDEFFAGIFYDASGSGSDNGSDEVTTPDSGEKKETKADGEEREKEADGEDRNDLVSKRWRRQLRNRDSAMKSRERKKMYVKELEMKSKYLESECRRLDYALRCSVAENRALHQRLQMGRPFSVPAAKQESAVLFVESLLLGSLFWLLSIVCLSLEPSLLQTPNPREGSRLGRGLVPDAFGSRTVAKNRIVGPDLGYEKKFIMRRCRGMRTRMKWCMFPRVVLVA